MRNKTVTIAILSLITAIFALLGWRLLYLQKFNQTDYSKASLRQHYATIIQTPKRGDIFDRRGWAVAISSSDDILFAEPRAFTNDEKLKEVSLELQMILDIPAHEICATILESKNPGYIKLHSPISASELKQIKEKRLTGIGIQSKWRRDYPTGQLMSHMVGFAGSDNNGLEGLERFHDKKLRGTAGKDIFVVDSARLPIAVAGTGDKAENGSSFILTVDTVIQEFTRNALEKQLLAFEAESATAVVMNPYSGAILAMVSLPDFDPDDLNASKKGSRRNRNLTDPFEPGSIFKPIVAAIAMDDGDYTKHDKIDCENGWFARYKIGEYNNHQYGMMTIGDIIIRSSNIGMAKIGLKMGKEDLYNGLTRFGIGQKTGIDLPGEARGQLRPTKKWSGWSVTRIPYGHEVQATSLQIARAYAALANGGQLVTPHIVDATMDPDGKVTELKLPPSRAGYIINPDIAKYMVQEAMVGVVNDEHGTGHNAAVENYQVFGKTGTANIAINGKYDKVNFTASFAGGAPAENPRIVIAVSIRKPNRSLGKGYSGGRVAAPVAKEIIEKTLTYLDAKQPR